MSEKQTQQNLQPSSDGLPAINVDDLLKMIGDRDVTIHRQGQLIALQTARIAELEQGEKSSVTKFDEKREKAS